jgi:small subunit ribosomal protein S6
VRSYELVFIVRPELEGDDLTAVTDQVTGLIERYSGKITQVEPWGLRRLAYPIQNLWEGQYVLMRLDLDAQNVAKLERDLLLIEQVIRHLVTRID